MILSVGYPAQGPAPTRIYKQNWKPNLAHSAASHPTLHHPPPLAHPQFLASAAPIPQTWPNGARLHYTRRPGGALVDVAWPGGALVDVAWWCVAPGKLVLAMREWMQLGDTRADVAAWRRAAPVGRGLAARSSGLPPPHRSGCRLGSEDTCRSVFGVPLRVAGTTRCPGHPSGQASPPLFCPLLHRTETTVSHGGLISLLRGCRLLSMSCAGR
jgi:hypothetical protein